MEMKEILRILRKHSRMISKSWKEKEVEENMKDKQIKNI